MSPRRQLAKITTPSPRTHLHAIRHPNAITQTPAAVASTTPSQMASLHSHIEAESRRWAQLQSQRQSRQRSPSMSSSSSSASSFYADSIFSHKNNRAAGHSSRRSSISSLATEFEPAPFVIPRDINGAPITVYASLEAAALQSARRVEVARIRESQSAALQAAPGASPWVGNAPGLSETWGAGLGVGMMGEGQREPRRLVTPGKLYENEESDDEIVGG
ncbi:hypothetical protein GGR57DRAFT_148264 [Xylariaceae sp. FL1272]|nr:hypothetical protein GGR57DRAFT_148264 [Xylariaceae sp. FL1272]